MVLNVNAAVIGTSAATEAGIGAEIGAVAAATSAMLTTVMPMGADLDSLQFAAALNAAGASYLAAATEHVANREAFSVAENLAAATYATTDAAANAALAL